MVGIFCFSFKWFVVLLRTQVTKKARVTFWRLVCFVYINQFCRSFVVRQLFVSGSRLISRMRSLIRSGVKILLLHFKWYSRFLCFVTSRNVFIFLLFVDILRNYGAFSGSKLGSLSNHDDDGNKNPTNLHIWQWKTVFLHALHVHVSSFDILKTLSFLL